MFYRHCLLISFLPLLLAPLSAMAKPVETDVAAFSTPLPPGYLPQRSIPPTALKVATGSSLQPDRQLSELTYTLGPGDVVAITVYDHPEFTGEQMILPDGAITLPLLGRVSAERQTAAQLQQVITQRLQRWLKQPVVTVGVKQLRSLRINIAGEVLRPGPIRLSGLKSEEVRTASNQFSVPTLSEALLLAGGITRKADIRRVTLRRAQSNGTISEQTINLWEALRSPQLNTDPILMDGDAIYIPTTSGESDVDRRLVARANFSPRTVRVRVVGEVKRPGEVEVAPDGTLSSAVAIAGGPTDKGRLDKVVFVRMNPQGQLDRQEVDLKNLTDTYQVQDGDVLLVPKDGGRNFLDVASQALGPFGLLFNLFR
ncbi:polysaccharide export protein [filamentous cyanobacterium LEGE 11480]|uniref:Polysaccharide export protein n=1 Tax=Romeriopsis navalis LEGE 11480 TaxID=2777977 RepID=A0A928VQ82_9CYAN|nr:polysaccharide biosynthesis/export family protein [Romeriopsis navalis]MBE9030595.1 polysaccharide export protein [Romeriopsis navalis LEGE 11480]